MAVHFQLIRKTASEVGPVNLVDLDAEIAREFGDEPDDVRYYYGWFDSIGWRLASGRTWDEIRAALQPSEIDDEEYCAVLSRLREIATWLEERFEVVCW